MANRTRTLEYSGAPFGRPADKLLPAGKKATAVTIVQGQDSISATGMSGGLFFYCGYGAGSFTNFGEVTARFPGKKYISIVPFVATGDCLDVEPGDAVPANCPSFVRDNPHPAHTAKPVIYTSAGDVQAVIDALSAAGIQRTAYIIWSAHWIGQHICSPASCGYPQADMTQYASNANFDSDEAFTWVWNTTPVTPQFPMMQGSTDGVGATAGPVHILQGNLNTWRAELGSKYLALAKDGNYGPLTAGAVTVAQHHFQNGAPSGQCDQALYADLAQAPGVVPAPTGLVTRSVLSTGTDATFAWKAVPGAGSYILQIEYYKDGFGWVSILNNFVVTALQTTQSLAPRLKYRWRVSANEAGHAWSAWLEFTSL